MGEKGPEGRGSIWVPATGTHKSCPYQKARKVREQVKNITLHGKPNGRMGEDILVL